MHNPQTEYRIEGYEFGPFRLDLVSRQLFYRREPLPLPSRTFDILKILVEKRGELVTKEELIKHVWPDRFVEESNLTVRMSTLRKALGETRQNRFIETVPSYGYRFAAKVNELLSKGKELPGKELNSIAVLPLINQNNQGRLSYLCDGITESLIASLSHITTLRVMARSTIFRYKGLEIDPQKVGRELGVEAILVGKVSKRSNSLVLDLEMIDARDGAYLWGAKYDRPITDLINLQEELVKEVSDSLRIKLSMREEHRVTKRHTSNPHAHLLYLKGRYFLNQRSVPGGKKAAMYFRGAVRHDPKFALAYAGLADAYMILNGLEVLETRGAMQKAKVAALKAIEIDMQLAEAHVSMGNIKSSYEFDWEGAGQEFKLAIELNPYYAPAHHYYANLLVKLGDFELAHSEINKAYEIDPLSLSVNLLMGKIYYFARRYGEAVKKAREILEMQPRYGVANGLIGLTYIEVGRYQEAVREFQIMFDSLLSVDTFEGSNRRASEDKSIYKGYDPEPLSFIGYAYALAGKRSKALKMLDELLKVAEVKYVEPHNIAIVYVGLGDNDKAFEWLDKAVTNKGGPITYIKVWPFFERIRKDPRYEQLVRRMRLEP